MRLLILTQKVDVNDDLLGFFHDWIEEFAKYAEKITVIALGVGEHRLPANVKVISLGKENGASKIKYVINFYRQIWRERKNYDAVFVHINKEYVILGGLLWRLLDKKIGLWYVHKKVSFQLKLAEKLANIIFSAAPESFKLKSRKVKFVGQAVNFKKFVFNNQRREKLKDDFRIIYVGRISQIKNQRLLIEAVNILVKDKRLIKIRVELVGSPMTAKDEEYLNELKRLVKQYNLGENINFIGSVPYRWIGQYLSQADLSVNLCPTGGMDKAVLESLASGVPAIAFNKIFSELFKGYEHLFILQTDAAGELARKITVLADLTDKESIADELKNRIKKNYSLENLADKIISGLAE